MKTVRIGLLGCGTVGSGLVELIGRNRSVVADRSGVSLEVGRVLVRDGKKPRPVPREIVTTDASTILDAPDIDVVVELIGGLEPARAYIARAIDAKKGVVTANKALLAASGIDLFRRAAERHVRIGFEASVCGGIPIIRAISAGLVGNRILTLVGIVNGTCNFILTRMTEEKCPFDAALEEARRRGFAEADPSLDLDGHDAAQKLQILAELAFGARLDQIRFPIEGIRAVAAEDIRAAGELGYVVKHIVVAKDLGDALDLRAHPALLPAVHPLAHVRNEFNSVLLRGDAVDEMIFTGKGAGSLPTASAVLSDIIEISSNGGGEPVWHPVPKERALVEDVESKVYLRFPIKDVPGVIGLIATALGNRGISISHAGATLDASRAGHGNVTILAHRCRASALRKSLEEISRLPVLAGKAVALPIFEEG
jgi:homoserine dehydrogenase